MSCLVQTSHLRLFLSCQQLVNLDTLSLTDAVVELLEQDWELTTWKVIWRTGVIWNSLNPEFVEAYEFDFFIEDHKKFLMKVYDVDRDHQDLATAELIGSAEFLVSELVTQPHMRLSKAITHPSHRDSRGLITARVEEVVDSNESVKLVIAAVQLPDPRNWFGGLFVQRSFFRLSRAMEAGDFQVVFASELRPGTDPTWALVRLSMSVLCNSDYLRPILLEVFCEAPCGMLNHILIGRVQFSIASLLDLGQAVLYLEGPASRNASLVIKHLGILGPSNGLRIIAVCPVGV